MNSAKKNTAAVGVGLRSEHFDYVLEHKPPVAWFECLTENFMTPGGPALRVLERVRADYPISFHGVSMNLGSSDTIDENYLKRLKWLVDTFEPEAVSDHLCWVGVAGENLHDLLPLPFTDEVVSHVTGRIQRVQEYLGRKILVENISTYLEYSHSEMKEWEFLREISRRAGVGLLLDINNIFVNSVNHDFSAEEYLSNLAGVSVGQFHLSGHAKTKSYLIDTHDSPVTDDVWDLYERALKQFGKVNTLIEWDNRVPPWEDLISEAQKAITYWERA